MTAKDPRRQLAAACVELCSEAGLEVTWTADGRVAAREIDLTADQRLVLAVAQAAWDGGEAPSGDVLFVQLRGDLRDRVLSFVRAHAESPDALDLWLEKRAPVIGREAVTPHVVEVCAYGASRFSARVRRASDPEHFKPRYLRRADSLGELERQGAAIHQELRSAGRAGEFPPNADNGFEKAWTAAMRAARAAKGLS